MGIELIWILNASSQELFHQQSEDWQVFAVKHHFKIKSFLNIYSMQEAGIINSIAEEIINQETTGIGFESYNVLSPSISISIHLASKIVDVGGKIFNVAYAIPSLVEIPKNEAHFMLKLDDFLEIEQEDIPFLLEYADKPGKLETLIYHLSGLKTSLENLDCGDCSLNFVIGDIRRAIILAELFQHDPT